MSGWTPCGSTASLTKLRSSGPRLVWRHADAEAVDGAWERWRKHQEPQQVLVVHGRNRPARNAMFSFLRSLGLQPIEWSQAVTATGKATPYIGEVLNAAFSMAQAVVVLMTPDDEVRLRPEFRSQNDADYESNLTGQARPNVLFEAGMAMGRDESRTVLVELGMLRPFSDIGGMHVIRIDNSSQRRQELARRLERAGCSVDLTGTDWHTEGDFEASVPGPNWMVETADGKRWTSRARCTHPDQFDHRNMHEWRVQDLQLYFGLQL